MNTKYFEDNYAQITKRMPMWVANVKKRLPIDWGLSDDEITSEIIHHLLYLSDKFKGGLFIAYCQRYVTDETWSALMREYSRLIHEVSLLDELIEKDIDEYGNEVVHHLKMDYEEEPYTSITDHIEIDDIKKIAKQKAQASDFKKIYNCLEAGMTERQIADILDIPKTTVHNKIIEFINSIKEN